MGLMGQQNIQDIKDHKDLKEQRYAKERQSGHAALESMRPGNRENPSRHNFRQLKDNQGSVLKAGNASVQNLDSILWELYDGGSWALSDRELFTYDSNGNMTTYIWFAYDSVEMKILPFDKRTVKHDDAGNPTEIIGLNWDNESGDWLNSYKFLLSYDGEGNLIQETTSDWDPDGNQWLEGARLDWTYDAKGNLIQRAISDWDPDGNQWLEGARFDLTYDASGNLILEIWNFWDEDAQKIVPFFQDEYLYEDGNLTTINEYDWEEGDWVLFFRTIYSYDEAGNLIEELRQFWNPEGEAWIDFGKTLYTYNENGKLILEEEWEISNTQFILVKTWQSEITWDTDGNMTSLVEKSWDEGSTKGTNSWQNAFKSEWTFNKDFTIADLFVPYWFSFDDSNITFVHMPVSETSYIYLGENWVMDSRQSAYYSDFGASTGIEDREETSLKIFPVPASETLTINWDDSFSNLRFELYDLTGKQVILRTIDNNETIGVNHLSGGIYLYKLSNNDHLIYSGKVSIR